MRSYQALVSHLPSPRPLSLSRSPCYSLAEPLRLLALVALVKPLCRVALGPLRSCASREALVGTSSS